MLFAVIKVLKSKRKVVLHNYFELFKLTKDKDGRLEWIKQFEIGVKNLLVVIHVVLDLAIQVTKEADNFLEQVESLISKMVESAGKGLKNLMETAIADEED